VLAEYGRYLVAHIRVNESVHMKWNKNSETSRLIDTWVINNECGKNAKLETAIDELNADKRRQASGNVLIGVETLDFDIRLENLIYISLGLDWI